MKTIAIDFDGVIHSYTSGWQGVEIIPDPPVPGAIEFVCECLGREGVEPVIYSTRAETPRGRYAIRTYLEAHGLPPESVFRVTAEKPKAIVYIDDRAWRFDGLFPYLPHVLNFKPWYRREDRFVASKAEDLANRLAMSLPSPESQVQYATVPVDLLREVLRELHR